MADGAFLMVGNGIAVVKLGITVNLGILGYLKIDRVISRLPVPVSQRHTDSTGSSFRSKQRAFDSFMILSCIFDY